MPASVDTQATQAWLRSTWHIQVPQTWLDACVEWVTEEAGGVALPQTELNQQVLNQWLLTDLRDLAYPILPDGISEVEKTELNGCYCLQMDSLLDVSQPAYSQLQRLRGSDCSNDDVSAVTQATQRSWEAKPTRMLMLQLTDGVQILEAIEYRTVPALSANLPPGTKLQIVGMVKVRLGVLLLKAENVKVLGGEVDELMETNSQSRLICRTLGLPEENHQHEAENEEIQQASRIEGTVDSGYESIPSSVNSQLISRNVPHQLENSRFSTLEAAPTSRQSGQDVDEIPDDEFANIPDAMLDYTEDIPDDFDHEPDHWDNNPNDFDHEPDHWDNNPDDFDHEPDNLGDFDHEPDDWDNNPDDLNHEQDNWDHNLVDFDHEPDDWDNNPEEFKNDPEDFDDIPMEELDDIMSPCKPRIQSSTDYIQADSEENQPSVSKHLTLPSKVDKDENPSCPPEPNTPLNTSNLVDIIEVDDDDDLVSPGPKKTKYQRRSQDCSKKPDTSILNYLCILKAGVWPPHSAQIVRLHAFIVTLLGSLRSSGGEWKVKATISDGTGYLDVDLSDSLLKNLIGFSAAESKVLRKDPAKRSVVDAGIQKCQRELVDMCCVMSVKVDSNGTGTVLRADPLTDRECCEIQRRVTNT
ncbi:RecQ-mediated genome instability protein 1 [Bagarius yarrelli]|uniref:RecQ-mediated genome instability protein 1 n=1 Tax=Bagarius yarrelli TaxID=175774 RepID=A0A556U283_BAGYA|nr:RecQ-mediated genome instability protein 1 [Bagarius yarrelli]